MSELAILGGKPSVTGAWPKWPALGQRERELLDEVFATTLWGGTGLGPKITELNAKFAAYCDCRYGAAVANGTVSMELCLQAWGIGPGDEVVVPAATFFATSIAAHHQGATVVDADLDPKTANLDPASFEAAISDRTKAVIPVERRSRGHGRDRGHRRPTRHQGPRGRCPGPRRHLQRPQDGLARRRRFVQLPAVKNMQSGEGGFICSNDAAFIDLIHYSIGKFGRGVRDKYAGHVHYNFGWNACYTRSRPPSRSGSWKGWSRRPCTGSRTPSA